MAEGDLRKWEAFFKDAGVPRGPAAEYATLFCDHRIKDDLLGDLTKDILNDIGITVMGDIMSILKHAKAVYAKLEREKSSNRLVLNANTETTLEENSQASPSPQYKKKKIVSKLSSKQNPPAITKVQPGGGSPSTLKKMLAVTNSKAITDDLVPAIPKKRPIKSSLTLSERFADEKVVPPKVSRELTGLKETNQTVIKKKAITGKTKPALGKGEQQTASRGPKVTLSKRKSAFERLGKEALPAQNETEMLTSKIKITKVAKSAVQGSTTRSSTPVSKGGSSVFKRLGETEPNHAGVGTTTRTIRTVTGLESCIISDDSKTNFKSHSILRPIKPTRAVKPVKSISPVNTTNNSLTSVDKRQSPEKSSVKKSVFSRLGSPAY